MPELYAFPLAFAVSIVIGPFIIKILARVKMGQKISEDGPQSHQAKAGTPTMGGLIILLGVLVGLVPYLSTTRKDNPDLTVVLALMFAYCFLGFVDDYLTVRPIKGVRGISSKPKAALQILFAAGFVYWMSVTGHDMTLSAFGYTILSGIWYQVFAVIFIAGMANFVNITDGLDGLVSGLAVAACFPMVAFLAGWDGFTAILLGLMGACIGFLWYNANPAKVFMGDTGSLAIGSVLPAIAIITHFEMVLIIAGLVFILDGLSSALQWAVFKFTRITTGTGKRVFLKSPVHHHFEMAGWPEQKIVIRFWIVGIMCASMAILYTISYRPMQ
ncbi:phospho-N-acetylmuramoyl-pentapeptide-transferase [bacterium]|nr:phospho-N-acetylmuramoyl-pentapeptide-transferase [bacterium]